MIYLNIMETAAVICHNVIRCLASNRKLFYTNVSTTYYYFEEMKKINKSRANAASLVANRPDTTVSMTVEMILDRMSMRVLSSRA